MSGPRGSGSSASAVVTVDEDPLEERIRREIRQRGPMTFARFMELALYDRQRGYYSRGPSGLGRDGDFFTAVDAGRDFGRCLARQLIEIAGLDGDGAPFAVLEYGAGRGLLARDVLETLERDAPALAARTEYRMIDRSAAMRAAATVAAPAARSVPPGAEGRGGYGCVLAVEFFDALPVHRLRRRGGRLLELGLDLQDRSLVERELEPAASVAAWAQRYGAAALEGQEAEVAPVLAVEFDRMTRAVDRGVWILVDYGDRARGLYGPARQRGTLLAYHRHRAGESYFERIGRQDLTAHVNFTALIDCARRAGLDVLGLTTQDRFLIGNGILEAFDPPAPHRTQDPRLAKRRLQALQLIHPSGMGRRFKVLVLSRGIEPPPALAGLADPFDSARGSPAAGEPAGTGHPPP